jgi:hypothetical protein
MTMRVFAKFSPEGDPLGFWSDDVWPLVQMPKGLTEISAEIRKEFTDNPGRRRWDGAAAVVFEPPPPPPPPRGVTYPADLWRRCTNLEADAIEKVVATMPVRERRIFETASFFDPGDPQFERLLELLTATFGADRAAELLEPS